MPSVITVRNLDPEVKQRIQDQARQHGRSMEAEIRSILEQAARPEPVTADLAWAVERFRVTMAEFDPAWEPFEFERPPSPDATESRVLAVWQGQGEA
ncbi:MAG: Arc family DNA-binding protein [Propionibacteriaceae bacterium]|jgi:plasmid stability protein|nr:Arc family DNA-binding protein [Propionibacteriaceae bacterium]